MNIEVETLNEPFVLAISLDKASEEPLHQQISEPLRTMILNNELNPGQLLEDEVGMAKRLDTSRTTVRRAFQNLADLWASQFAKRWQIGQQAFVKFLQALAPILSQRNEPRLTLA